jgi:pyruvate dehydrogenase (quinone)
MGRATVTGVDASVSIQHLLSWMHSCLAFWQLAQLREHALHCGVHGCWSCRQVRTADRLLASSVGRMPEQTVADAIVSRLREWGVDRVFGYSGDGINGFIGAIARADGGPQFVQARHEENAAFMAVGHAKYTGSVGVVTSTQGPGAVHLLNGLYDAKLDHVPVVAIVGQQQLSALGSEFQQEIDLQVLFADVAAQYTALIASPAQVPSVIDRAFRTALSTRSPTVVIVAHDVQNMSAVKPEAEHGVMATAVSRPVPIVIPQQEDLDAAGNILRAGKKVALLVGQGARDAQAEVVAIAERLGAGIATSLLGKPYVDETLPFAAGTMGHLGTTASAFLLGHCDTLLIIGSNDPWTEFYPQPGQARAVQIDIDGRHLGNRYPIEQGLVGDAATTLTALLELLPPVEDRGWRNDVENSITQWREIRDRRADVTATRINPERVLSTLSPLLPRNSQIALDVGSVVYWYARQLLLPPGAAAHVSGTLASMGCSVPYGIAGKLAAPARPMVVLSGDGGFQMTGVAELITVSRLWHDWDDPRFIVCILNNGDLAEVSWEQREMDGFPRFAQSQDLPDFPAADYAHLLGLAGERVTDTTDLPQAWQRAFTADRPYVLDIITDPSIPLLAPFPAGASTLDQMRTSIEKEGAAGAEARRLLDIYAAHESN